MIDYMTIGSTPCEEECAQVGSENYRDRAIAECRRFIDLIRKKLGDEPPNAQLAVKGFPHDFGTYYEVVCKYSDEDEKAQAYAYKCESDAPTTWKG